MFLLTRQDVEIVNLPDPQGKQVAILRYQTHSFRLIKVFGDQRKEALTYWRELIDDKGMVCILLEEPQRYSIWGQVFLPQADPKQTPEVDPHQSLVQGGIILLQSAFKQVEQSFGVKKAASLQLELLKIAQKSRLPQANSLEAIANLLKLDPLDPTGLPPWDDSHIQNLLGELHRLLVSNQGADKTQKIVDQSILALGMLPQGKSISFNIWLNNSPKGKLWSKK